MANKTASYLSFDEFDKTGIPLNVVIPAVETLYKDVSNIYIAYESLYEEVWGVVKAPQYIDAPGILKGKGAIDLNGVIPSYSNSNISLNGILKAKGGINVSGAVLSKASIDGQGIVDAILNKYTYTLTDTVTLADTLPAFDWGVILDEGLFIIDDPIMNKMWINILQDSFEFSVELLYLNLSISVSDIFWVNDLLLDSGSSQITLADLIELTDSSTGIRGFYETLTSTMTMSEVLNGLESYYLELLDTLYLLSTCIPNGEFTQLAATSLSFYDDDTIINGVFHNLADTFTLSDTLAAVGRSLLVISDSLQYSTTVDYIRTLGAVVEDTLSLTDTAIGLHAIQLIINDDLSFSMRIKITGTVKPPPTDENPNPTPIVVTDFYQCWVWNTNAFYPSMYTNFNFTSYIQHGNTTYGTKSDGLYTISGSLDETVEIDTGVKMVLGNINTQHEKRFFLARFGLVGETPALKVTTENGDVTYYVINGKAKLGKGQRGRSWTFDLVEISEVDFVELVPVILQK